MIVVDASVVVDVLASTEPDPALAERLDDDDDLRAPHLIDLEFLNALRRLVAKGELNGDRASDALADLHDLRLVRYPHLPLVDRAWSFRSNLTAYDVAYVALAELLEVPLLTCDMRLAASTGHDAEIELFPPPS